MRITYTQHVIEYRQRQANIAAWRDLVREHKRQDFWQAVELGAVVAACAAIVVTILACAVPAGV